MPEFWCIWDLFDEGVLAYFEEKNYKGAENRTFKTCLFGFRHLNENKKEKIIMILTQEQQAILDGSKGETMAKVMKTLVMYGEAFNAEKKIVGLSLQNSLISAVLPTRRRP